MARAMEHSAFGGRKVGEAIEVAYKMFSDPDAFVVATFSGAMTPAGMGSLVCEMLDKGYIQVIVSTGALITHGFVESTGRAHFLHDNKMSDLELFEKGYNRIYDVVELEKNLDDIEEIVHQVLALLKPGATLSSRVVTHLLGQWLAKHAEGRGILKSAYRKNVPVYIPAFTDSELGLDIAIYNRKMVAEEKKQFAFNPFFDLEHFLELINQQKKIGIFTIGGGVPRNWAQQIAPYSELICGRMPKGKAPPHLRGIKYSCALRICPDAVEWGGLSGCPYSEGKSWGKFTEDCMTAEVLADATMVWPFIIKAVGQRLRKNGFRKIKKNFNLKEQLKTVDGLTEQYRLQY